MVAIAPNSLLEVIDGLGVGHVKAANCAWRALLNFLPIFRAWNIWLTSVLLLAQSLTLLKVRPFPTHAQLTGRAGNGAHLLVLLTDGRVHSLPIGLVRVDNLQGTTGRGFGSAQPIADLYTSAA